MANQQKSRGALLKDVLTTTLATETKRVLANTGNVNGQTESAAVQWVQQVGLASRPAKPANGKAAQAVVVEGGGIDIAIASQDVRFNEVYGSLAEGEVCLFAVGPDGTAQARILLKANGSINLYTVKGNAAGGKSMGVFINTDGSINIASDGNGVLVGADKSVKIFNDGGALQIMPDGKVKLSAGPQLALSGGSVAIGGPSGLPIAIGPQTVTAITALQTEATAIQTEETAAQAFIAAIAAWAAAIQADPTHAAASSLIGAVTATAAAVVTAAAAGAAAVTAGAATVSAQTAIIPSLRTTSD